MFTFRKRYDVNLDPVTRDQDIKKATNKISILFNLFNYVSFAFCLILHNYVHFEFQYLMRNVQKRFFFN